MAERVAVVDLGSNTFRLVVFTVGRSSAGRRFWYRSDEIYQPVRLAEGLAASGRLQEGAQARAFAALEVFSHFLQATGIPAAESTVVATGAVRAAANGSSFLVRAQEQSGLPVRLLSGEEEARYGYLAAANTTTLTDGYVLELGGGSLQLVKVRERVLQSACSLPLGTVTLSERFLAGGRESVGGEALAALRAYLRAALAPWLGGDQPARVVGIGGVVRNLATALQPVALPTVQGAPLERRALRRLIGQLAALPAGARTKIRGIKPSRADLIVAGAVVVEVILELVGAAALEATEAGLREGIFFERFYSSGGGLGGPVREEAPLNLCARYGVDGTHTFHLAKLALALYDQLLACSLFQPLPAERQLLWAAALLHDLGMAVDYDDHHRHSRYLILSAGLPGYSPSELALIAQATRFHRKGDPSPGPFNRLLGGPNGAALLRISTLLRLAEGLERARDQAVAGVGVQRRGDGIALALYGAGSLTLQRWAVAREGDLFRRAFGVDLAAIDQAEQVAAPPV